MSIQRRLIPALLPLAAGLLGAPALAQTERSWTSIGSAGAVNPTQQASVEHSINWARVPFNATSGEATLHYNVTAVDGLFVPPPNLSSFAFGMRFIDNGASGRVQLRLRSYDRSNGTLTTLETLDSNNVAPSSSAQSTFRCIAHEFDFSRRAYFVEAVLSKTALAGRAQIGAMWLTPTDCIVTP
ncbi:MAG TPA: hypothetical protein VFY73_08475 [Ideonella sp.]|uniref:hypothetical protein n=1 Tax=Ideonella sp. TaxID=1929293 RepID=UPI002E36F544|nr:hypothetical protein [Ideonella sp.]HEX5684057.1 hypothetical protein [Ideonella sp.]